MLVEGEGVLGAVFREKPLKPVCFMLSCEKA